MSPEALEQLIESARQHMLTASTPEARRAHSEAMCALIAQRTPETILRMEREKGLR